MKTLVFDAHSYDRTFLDAANRGRHELIYTQAQLDHTTAAMAEGFEAVCLFVNDHADERVMARLASAGVRVIVQRSTGHNNIDLTAAQRHGIRVMRVTSYSPYSVAEHAVALLMTLNRRVHRSFNRTREFNFRLAGLMGRDIHGSTVGVVGTGQIGSVFARILHGFGCSLLGHDARQHPDCLALGMKYVPLEELLANSDIISLHAPLTPETHHLINARTLALVKPDAFLINTSRGGLVDTDALIAVLQRGAITGVGLG